MPLSSLVTELLIYTLAVVCLVHAWRQTGPIWLYTFAGASIFGFILEYAAIKTHHDYCYGKFLIMLPPWGCNVEPIDPCPCPGSVPLWITLGWGVVVYMAMQTSSRMDVPWFIRPVIDVALAVNVDWVMDPLAQRLGWWHWSRDGWWYGVPMDNFMGWIVMVGSFSFTIRWLRRHLFKNKPRAREYATPFIAAAIGPLVVTGIMQGYLWLQNKGVSEWILLGVPVGIIYATATYFALRSARRYRPDYVVMGVALTFQVYYSAGLVITGLAGERQTLPLMMAIAMAFCIFGYSCPYHFRSETHTRDVTPE